MCSAFRGGARPSRPALDPPMLYMGKPVSACGKPAIVDLICGNLIYKLGSAFVVAHP